MYGVISFGLESVFFVISLRVVLYRPVKVFRKSF